MQLLLQLAYGSGKYMVTGKSEPRIPEGLSWNRDDFRLICQLTQLTALVTVDISKLPRPKSRSCKRI
jgi:hypothetical protein